MILPIPLIAVYNQHSALDGMYAIQSTGVYYGQFISYVKHPWLGAGRIH